MPSRPIRTEDEHEAALRRVEELLDATPGTPYGDELELLILLIEAYEDEHCALPLPDPIEAILYHMESRGLTEEDLGPCLGERQVAAVLERHVPLSLEMIRRVRGSLGIPADILIQPYACQQAA
ncbi:MAG: transcriptional regulator [bacterium]|nr:transcriptional regulator [bacterium]